MTVIAVCYVRTMLCRDYAMYVETYVETIIHSSMLFIVTMLVTLALINLLMWKEFWDIETDSKKHSMLEIEHPLIGY